MRANMTIYFYLGAQRKRPVIGKGRGKASMNMDALDLLHTHTLLTTSQEGNNYSRISLVSNQRWLWESLHAGDERVQTMMNPP